MNFRFERKFYTDRLSKKYLESIVLTNSIGFKKIYKPRLINSIYYDDNDYTSYFENEEGQMNRRKIRFRWYDNNIEEGQFEFKIKNNLLGSKINFKKNNLSKEVKYIIKNLSPILQTSYTRDYYQSFDKKIRITIDTNIQYTRISKELGLNKITENGIVLEIKYSPEYEKEIDIITNKIPLSIVKFSKYSRGLSKLYN